MKGNWGTLYPGSKTAKSPDQLPRLSEAAFMRQVLDLARLLKWRPYHTHDSRRSNAGFPDLCLVRERVVWIELKSNGGKLRPDQTAWVEDLRRAKAEVYVFRPSDWPEIERVLGGSSNG